MDKFIKINKKINKLGNTSTLSMKNKTYWETY